MTGGRVGVAVLGSTGSIGRQALEVIAHHPERFEVRALAAGGPSLALDAQLAEWPTARTWTSRGAPPDLFRGQWAEGGLVELATLDGVGLVVVASTGMVALPAVLAALEVGKRVALANKETLVAGGHLVAAAVDRLGGDHLDWLRPIDSEHSAIWQCLLGENRSDVFRLILTASGGPFRDWPVERVASVPPEQALAHPTWRMGPKITIDSATLVNKAFEAIEARWLYRLPYPRIEAVIHPASIVHSLVEFVDGAFKAQLGIPDMRLPIQYALTHPRRWPSPARYAPPSDWGTLEFRPIEEVRYPAYRIVREAAAAGGNRGVVVNAADEVAVQAFLAGSAGFDAIPGLIGSAVERWGADHEPDLGEIHALDREVREGLAADLGIGQPV